MNLKKLYSKIPKVTGCMKGCTECCDPVPCTEQEFNAIPDIPEKLAPVCDEQGNATASKPHSEDNADAMRTHEVGNAPSPSPSPSQEDAAVSCPDNDSEDGDGGSGGSPAKKKTPLQQVKEMRPDWWNTEEWAELIAHRTALKASKGKRAYKLLVGEFDIARAAGETPQSILDDMSSGKGWVGYKFEWVENKRGSRHANGKDAASPFKIDQDKPVENWLE